MFTKSETSSQEAVYNTLLTTTLLSEPVKLPTVRVADVSVTFVNNPG